MSPNNETLLLQTLNRLADEVRELRSEVSRLSGVVAKLEAIQAGSTAQCVARHSSVDSRLESLESEQERSGLHEVDELKRKLASKNDWTTWIMRTVAGALIASALAGGGYFARGCSPQNVVVAK